LSLSNLKTNCHGASLEEENTFLEPFIFCNSFSKSSETLFNISNFLAELAESFTQTADQLGGHHFNAATVNSNHSDLININLFSKTFSSFIAGNKPFSDL